MDNDKKLFEGLLKADGIDPAGISEAERMVFREMLDSEKKRMKHLSWLSVGAMWIFVLAMIGLCVSEKVLEALRIPFVVAWLGLMATMCFIFITRFPRHNRKIKESNKKISKLHYLVHGKHRGLILIGKKDGKRLVYWLRIIMIAAAVWLVVSLGGAGSYYLLCQRWIFSLSPMLYIFFCTAVSLSFVIFLLREGLKAPLDELVEVKVKSKQSKPSTVRPDIWRIIMKSRITKLTAAAVIIIAILIAINQFGGSIDMATIAFADIAKAMKKVQWMHQVSRGFERGITGSAEQWIGFEAKIHAAKWADGKVYLWDIEAQRKYEYNPQNGSITINYASKDDFPLNLSSPVLLLESMYKMLKEQGAKIITKSGKYNGQQAQIQKITFSSVGQDNENQTLTLYIRPDSKLLCAAKIKGTDSNGNTIMDGEITFSYPQTGPTNIYDLGVPHDAQVINNLPKGSE